MSLPEAECRARGSKESMASNPGILTDWPWKPLGSFKVMSSPSFSLMHTLASTSTLCHTLTPILLLKAKSKAKYIIKKKKIKVIIVML